MVLNRVQFFVDYIITKNLHEITYRTVSYSNEAFHLFSTTSNCIQNMFRTASIFSKGDTSETRRTWSVYVRINVCNVT